MRHRNADRSRHSRGPETGFAIGNYVKIGSIPKSSLPGWFDTRQGSAPSCRRSPAQPAFRLGASTAGTTRSPVRNSRPRSEPGPRSQSKDQKEISSSLNVCSDLSQIPDRAARRAGGSGIPGTCGMDAPVSSASAISRNSLHTWASTSCAILPRTSRLSRSSARLAR